MTSAGSLFATSSKIIRGVEFNVFTNAPSDLRDYFVLSNTHFAGNEFLVYDGERLTYGEVHERTIALCCALQNLGVQPGDRVAVAMRNYPEYCVAVHAILSIGAVAVTLNSWWRHDELEYGLRDSGARFAFVDQERWLRLADSCPLLDLGVAITPRKEKCRRASMLKGSSAPSGQGSCLSHFSLIARQHSRQSSGNCLWAATTSSTIAR